MPDATSRGKRICSFVLIRLPMYLAVVLVLYVLSIGPMYWTWYESYALYENHDDAMQNPDRVTLFYLPLIYACQENKDLRDYVNWYLDFWV